jgi:hypothetical protein
MVIVVEGADGRKRERREEGSSWGKSSIEKR